MPPSQQQGQQGQQGQGQQGQGQQGQGQQGQQGQGQQGQFRSVYQEQFSSPGRVRRTQIRPSSAHRRNNPQPRSDFLFPLSLKSRAQRPLVVERSRTSLPPIGPPHSPGNHGPVTQEEKATQLNMPPIRVLHTTATVTATTAAAKATRSLSDAVLQGRPHTTVPQQRALSLGSLEHSGCCSCFHRVKPFQSGHYTIHPDFASEMIYNDFTTPSTQTSLQK